MQDKKGADPGYLVSLPHSHISNLNKSVLFKKCIPDVGCYLQDKNGVSTSILHPVSCILHLKSY
jgi:hypothetical protein